MVRPPCIDSNGMKKGAWSKEEDDKLRKYILRYGHWNWRLLPKFAGLARCGKSCRLRWVNYLKPGIKRGNFTKHEQDLVIQLHAQLGNKWSAIAARLPGRTDNEVKNFWHTRFDKQKRNSLTPKGMTPNEDDDDDDNDNDNNDDNGVSSIEEAQELLMKEAAETTTTTVDTNPTATNLEQFSPSSSSAVNNSDHERLHEIETCLAADIFLPENTTSTYDVDCFAPLMEEVGYNYDDIMNGFNTESGHNEMSISSDSTYLTALDNWSIADLEDCYTISSNLWGALDFNSSTLSSEKEEAGFHDALQPDQFFNHGFDF